MQLSWIFEETKRKKTCTLALPSYVMNSERIIDVHELFVYRIESDMRVNLLASCNQGASTDSNMHVENSCVSYPSVIFYCNYLSIGQLQALLCSYIWSDNKPNGNVPTHSYITAQCQCGIALSSVVLLVFVVWEWTNSGLCANSGQQASTNQSACNNALDHPSYRQR